MRNPFATVYCEDCKHCVPSDGEISNDDGAMCKAYPIEVDCSGVDTFVTKDRYVKIVKTYKRCDNIRCRKSMPIIYCSYCFKFSPKIEKSY